MGFKAKLKKFAKSREQWGTTRALNVLLGGLLNRLGININYVFVAANNGLPRNQAPDIPPGYETRPGKLQDFLDFDGKGYDYDLSSIETSFTNGDHCAVTFFEGILVGYRFNTCVEAPVTSQLSVRIPEGFNYAYKAWIHPDHRQKNLDKRAVWVIQQCQLESQSAKRDLWYIATHNYPSLLHGYIHPSERSLRMGLVGWVTLCGKQYPFSSRRAKWLGLEFRRNCTVARQYI